jgi:hypothetical protein
MRFLATLLLMSACACPASANKSVWGFIQTKGDARLYYGLPESDAVTISIVCESHALSVISTVLPRTATLGKSTIVTVANGSNVEKHTSTVRGTNEDGLFTEFKSSTILQALQSGTSISISVPGKSEIVPLRGVARPLAKFRSACPRQP